MKDGIDFPGNGFWGQNILAGEQTFFQSGVRFSIGAMIPKSRKFTIVMRNFCCAPNIWLFSFGGFKDLYAKAYDDQLNEQLLRFYDGSGERDIKFQGAGAAQVLVLDEKGVVVHKKDIQWS